MLLLKLIYLKKCCKFATKYSLILLLPLFLIGTSSCSKSKQKEQGEEIFEKKRINPNPEEKAIEFRDKGGGIFNSSRKKDSTTFEFSSSNPLWRATLETINFMPLANVDYAGGIIITDWYSSEIGKNEIKLNIRFLSTELSSNSVSVTGFIKDCSKLDNKCVTTASNQSFNNEVKLKILEKAREITIKNETQNKK
jgi:hypothetical protein